MREIRKFLFLCFVLSFAVLLPLSVKAEPTVPETPEVVREAGWAYEDGNYRYYYSDNGTVNLFTSLISYTTARPAVIEFSTDTTCTTESGTITFKAGKYYFDKDGNLDLTTNSTSSVSVPVYKPGSNGTLTLKSTSWYRIVPKAATVTTSGTKTTITSNTVYFSGVDGSRVFKSGLIYKSGYVYVNGVMYTTDKEGYYTSKSTFTGVLNSSYVDASAKKVSSATKKCYKDGKLYTGLYNKTYYVKGVKQTKSEWKKIGKKIYYLNKGVAVTGSQYLKSYGGGSTKYHYTFDSNGVLKTDLLTSNVSKWKSKKLKVEVNVSTHTTTILAYNSKTKKYDTPLKAFVCSTPKKASNQKYGNFNINRNGTKRWFAPAIAKGKRIYQWASQIYGSGALFHSQVYTARNNRTFVASSYNGLGTNQTSYCIRVQAINAKILYDISNAHKGTTSARIPVRIYKSSTSKGAFGQVKLSDTTGKIPTSQKYDPTDPTIKK